MLGPFKKNRALGVAQPGGRYDLPLTQSAGSGFLIMLVGLMTFLAMMAISATMALSSVTQHWSSGLENRLTIEIPAVMPDENIRSPEQISVLAGNITKILSDNPNIQDFQVLGEKEIQDLVAPWLGEDIGLDNIPLPGLISVHLKNHEVVQMEQLQNALHGLSPDITLDTHESWLADIIRMASSLKISAGAITLIIALTTITAIAGAIRSRMSEYKDDIELLHLMGAGDLYITKQFQRHALMMSLQGSIIGAACGFVLMGIMMIISDSDAHNMLPDFSLSALQILALLALPPIVAAMAAQTARITVLRVLSMMP